MKVFCLYVLAVMMALVSFQVIDQKGFTLTSDLESETISAVEVWNLNPLKEADTKTSSQQNYIAQAFIPIVTLASELISHPTFTHYLPLYDLIRSKNFFLLI